MLQYELSKEVVVMNAPGSSCLGSYQLSEAF